MDRQSVTARLDALEGAVLDEEGAYPARALTDVLPLIAIARAAAESRRRFHSPETMDWALAAIDAALEALP